MRVAAAGVFYCAVSFAFSLCVDGELVCAEGCTQVTGVMAMMMAGRVLLVCALCVLWSVPADGDIGVVSGGEDNILKELFIPVARLQLIQEQGAAEATADAKAAAETAAKEAEAAAEAAKAAAETAAEAAEAAAKAAEAAAEATESAATKAKAAAEEAKAVATKAKAATEEAK
ncbi:mucin-associated surface protein (MASP), partial [Trypanosoma cruzi]